MGYTNLRKIYKKQSKWTEKGVNRHKHNFSVHSIVKLRNILNHVEYYDVMKCEYCNSFQCISKEGSVSGFITEQEYMEKYNHLPILKMYRGHKYSIGFDDMELDKEE